MPRQVILSFPASNELAETIQQMQGPGITRARILRALVRIGIEYAHNKTHDYKDQLDAKLRED